jgi:hypothetical protein
LIPNVLELLLSSCRLPVRAARSPPWSLCGFSSESHPDLSTGLRHLEVFRTDGLQLNADLPRGAHNRLGESAGTRADRMFER